MLTAAIACYRAWRAEGGRAAAVAGHSLGEYSALVAAGALTLADALPLVRLRAQAMQEAVPVGAGAMAAILGLDAEQVREAAPRWRSRDGEVVSRRPTSTTRSRPSSPAARPASTGLRGAEGAGAKRALPLAVSAPFHSSLMKPAAERLRERLAGWRCRAARSRWSTTSTSRCPTDPTRSATRCTARPSARCAGSRWCRRCARAACTHVVECGPGKVLAGMVKRIDAELVRRDVLDPASLAEAKGLLA
jgi:[acyl-carrier-protein] S-malonyltransferase